ncbi:MAG: O-antigen ligase family protein [Alphaproteobacteria bacterium]|nr:O-antigen ligase family protein [Alphaproteobacteria bacterium]MBU1513940.1 O-antigen ligase family protein [Alphaproteobacteria bacterium]MBU2092628.1 O-antigen ligase family protein [Alphaproteobacteria bacterium]MBU2154251.1 O-antigen ligase family protein [Alphaproteobacteria bacterium]MBU2309503.1 O-antigen ligase family protein [Alphaproteobacteria bacterium]
MTDTTTRTDDRLGVWCGWVMAGTAALTPLLAWLGPLGFAPLLGLAGLLCVPALKIGRREAPLAVVLLAAVAWAAFSTFWSVHKADELEDSVALKLLLQLPLYWAAWQGARRADPRLRRLALRIFAWGLAAYGALLLVEAFTGAAIYRGLRDLLNDPIRPDLGRKNIAHGSFVLALLWPVAAAGGFRAGAPAWLALPMAAGTALLAHNFLSDAPVLAVFLAVAVGGLVWVWPRTGPKALALAAAGLVLTMPLLILAVRLLGLGQHLPESWEQRVVYWTYAMERIAEHPWRGWGLDASRAFSPHIQLHPHNGALQIWLELGLLGAAAAALAWAFAFRRLARDERSLVAAATAGSAGVYLLFALVNFGVWQEWWLALAALVAVIAALGDAEEAASR